MSSRNGDPSSDKCIALLREQGCSKEVLVHSQAVAELALAIAACIPAANPEIVRIGALLHDIGRSINHGFTHAALGADIIAQAGLPAHIVEIVRAHLGAGLTEKEAAALGLPPGDYMPRSLEARIVAQADNLIGGTKRRTLEKIIKKYRKKGNETGAERIKALHQELSALAGIDLDRIGD
ncbi:HD domain-containing protein [Planctomycetota bacterium]